MVVVRRDQRYGGCSCYGDGFVARPATTLVGDAGRFDCDSAGSSRGWGVSVPVSGADGCYQEHGAGVAGRLNPLTDSDRFLCEAIVLGVAGPVPAAVRDRLFARLWLQLQTTEDLLGVALSVRNGESR